MLNLVLMAAVAVTLVSSDQIDNKVDIGATVKEVEAMLAKDPRLPRLTRGEILKLIDEVRTGKDVVVVLPDNQSPFNESAPPTTTKPRRPVKRRRKKPTVRPVYVHTTTPQPSAGDVSFAESSTAKTSTEPAATSSTTQQAVWTPYSSTTRSPVRIVPVTPTPDNKLTGGLPPVPGLSLVENINSWSASSTVGPTKDVFSTPIPPVASSPPPSQSSGGLENPPNMKVAAESLGPEMKDLLTKFGLLGTESSTTERHSFQSDFPAPTIDPEVYSRFKPLPVKTSSSDFVSPDMKSLLASYGLLDSRQGKDLKAESSQQDSNTPLDYIPDREKSILSALGLWRDGKAIDLAGSPKNVPKHVFKPKKVDSSSSKEELEKVTKILSKIKEIGEGNESQMTELSPSDVEELLLLENNTRLAAQDELDLSEESDSSEEKNEVKRNPQQSSASASASADAGFSASSSASASSSSGGSISFADASASADSGEVSQTTTTEATTTTESSSSTSDDTTERGASAVDLEDSFGGSGSISTTTKRPNGFYFLLDWNSFLDLGLDDRAIHLNFSPKVGNPANFLPVEIGKSGTPGSR